MVDFTQVNGFISSTIAQIDTPPANYDDSVNALLSQGINKAINARSKTIINGIYESAKSGFTRNSHISTGALIDASNTYLSDISTVCNSAFQYADSMQTKMAQSASVLIAPQLKAQVDLEVEQIQLNSKMDTALVEQETEVGKENIQITYEKSKAKIDEAFKIQSANVRITGEIAAKQLEVDWEVKTMADTNAIELTNEMAVDLIKYQGNYDAQAYKLSKEIINKEIVAIAQIQAKVNTANATEQASLNEISARNKSTLQIGDANLNAKQLYGDTQISNATSIDATKLITASAQNKSKLDAFDITSKAELTSSTNQSAVRLLAQNLENATHIQSTTTHNSTEQQSQSDKYNAQTKGKIAVNSEQLSAINAKINTDLSAKTTVFNATTTAKGLENTQELQNIIDETSNLATLIGERTALKEQLLTKRTSAELTNKGNVNNAELLAASNEHLSSFDNYSTLLSARIDAKKSDNSIRLHEQSNEFESKRYEVVQDNLSHKTIAGLQFAQSNNNSLARMSAETSSELSLIDQHTQSSALHVTERLTSQSTLNGQQEQALTSRNAAEITSATLRNDTTLNAETLQNQQRLTDQTNENSARLTNAQSLATARIASSLSTSNAQTVAQLSVDNAHLSASTQENAAQLTAQSNENVEDIAAQVSELSAKAYVENSKISIQNSLAIQSLSFDLTSKATELYVENYLKLQSLINDRTIAGVNMVQFHSILNNQAS